MQENMSMVFNQDKRKAINLMGGAICANSTLVEQTLDETYLFDSRGTIASYDSLSLVL